MRGGGAPRGGAPRGGGPRGSFGGGSRGDSRGARGGGGPMFRGRGGGSFRQSDKPVRQVNPTKLHVTNLPDGCSKQQLEELFDSCGKVVECDIVKDYAFVHFRTKEEAEKAVEELNNYDFKGKVLVVKHSTSVLRQKPGAAAGDCFKCGGRGHSSTECPTPDDDEYGAGPPVRRGPPPAYAYPLPPRDPYARLPPPPPARDPFYDPYERLALRRPSPYMRPPIADPYLRDPYLRDPYADPYLRMDPYARPPPEFYARQRSRAMAGGLPPPRIKDDLAPPPAKKPPRPEEFFYDDPIIFS